MLRTAIQSLRRNGQWTQKRGFAAGQEEYVNFWEAPLSLSKWKKEQVVFAVLGGWGVVIYGGRKYLSSGKPAEPPPEKV